MLYQVAAPIIQPRMRFFDADGRPLVGGKVYSFKVGTELFKPTYRDAQRTALNTNPVVLDGDGSALIYLSGAHVLRVYDKNGNFIEDRYLPETQMRTQFFDKYGVPLKNGKVWTYDIASTIKKTSYANADKNQPNTNPVVLDANGWASISMVGSYRLRSYSKNGVHLGDQDFKRPLTKALTSRVYPLYLNDSISCGFNTNDLDRYDITWKESVFTENTLVSFSVGDVFLRDSSPIPISDSALIQLNIGDVLLTQPPKCDLYENLGSGLTINNVLYTIPINTNIDEQINTSFFFNNVVVEYI